MDIMDIVLKINLRKLKLTLKNKKKNNPTKSDIKN